MYILKKESNNYYYKNIYYESESVDIFQNCCQYLQTNNYYQNDDETNIFLLERALINYSILKLRSFGIKLSKLNSIDCDNLTQILKQLDKFIPTLEQKQSFFAQYIHCIIYAYSDIKKQEPIKIEMGDITIMDDNTNPTKVILDKNLPEYQKTLELLNMIKNTYKKNPVLKK